MAGRRGNIKLAITITGLALLCVIAYYVLQYLVTPHPPHVDYPVPSDLPPNAEVYDGGYVVYHNASNYTAVSGGIGAEPAYNVSTGPGQSADYEPVGFFELPLWIQLYVLPSILFGIIATFFTAFFVVRRIKNNENSNKRDVFAYIRGNPGCTAPELARDEGLNIGTARYHIQRLEDEGRIVLEKIGKYSRIFVNSHTYDEREKIIASHLHSNSSLSIIKALMETPGLSNQSLSEKLGMEKSLVFRYMQKLLEDGVVTCEWEGKSKLYYIDMGARETLTRLMPLHYQCPGLMKE